MNISNSLLKFSNFDSIDLRLYLERKLIGRKYVIMEKMPNETVEFGNNFNLLPGGQTGFLGRSYDMMMILNWNLIKNIFSCTKSRSNLIDLLISFCSIINFIVNS